MGWWCTSYAFGGLIASAYAGWACQWFGWRFLLLPKWNALPLTAGDAKGEACQEED